MIAANYYPASAKLLWDKADRETRDFWCSDIGLNGIKISKKQYQNSNDTQSLEEVIQEMEEHVRTNLTSSASNNITFWNEHKGKIALVGIAGLCIAGAVAAYVLAYPIITIVLAAAAAILTVIGVAKVLENPSVKNPLAQQQGVSS